jgi:hypothetical protein
MISHRGAAGRALDPTRGVRLAISMSQMTDRSTSIYTWLVKGEDDDSFIPIWSRRNCD